MKIFKQGAKSLLKIFLLVVTLYFASLLGIRLAGFDFAVVMSDSMSPGINRGDLVILKSAAANSLTVGEIVQYRKGIHFVLHRIVSIEERGIRTKGDANKGADPLLVSREHITAKAVGLLRGFGTPALLVQQIIQIDATNALFTRQHSRTTSIKSSIWTDPIAKWKQISGGGTYSFTSPSQVSSTGSGNRTLLLSRNKTTDQNFYTSLKLTSKDASSTAVYLNLEVCATTTITCGWTIGFNETTKTLSVQTYSPTGNRETPIYFKQQTFNLGTELKIVCHISSSLLQVRIDDVQVLNIQNPYSLAQSKGVTIPNGSYFGFTIVNANQFKSSKTMTW